MTCREMEFPRSGIFQTETVLRFVDHGQISANGVSFDRYRGFELASIRWRAEFITQLKASILGLILFTLRFSLVSVRSGMRDGDFRLLLRQLCRSPRQISRRRPGSRRFAGYPSQSGHRAGWLATYNRNCQARPTPSATTSDCYVRNAWRRGLLRLRSAGRAVEKWPRG